MPAPTRTWIFKRHTARVRVETVHPQHGPVTRGWITGAGVDHRPGVLAGEGNMRWTLTNYDYEELPAVVGNYIDAERALLDATTCMDE